MHGWEKLDDFGGRGLSAVLAGALLLLPSEPEPAFDHCAEPWWLPPPPVHAFTRPSLRRNRVPGPGLDAFVRDGGRAAEQRGAGHPDQLAFTAVQRT